MQIIFPALSYDEALSSAELVPLVVRKQQLTDKLLQEIISDTSHKLYDLLPPAKNCQINLRRVNHSGLIGSKRVSSLTTR